MIPNFPLLSQNDQRWKSKKLGSSSVTIGGYGCLITCISALITYYGIPTDPDRLNDWLTKNGGYENNNRYYWNSAGRFSGNRVNVYSRFSSPGGLSGTDWERINQEILKKRPVILQVDFYPTTDYPDMHFVVFLGDGQTMDPWNGKIEPLSKYGGSKKVINYIFHNGQVPKEDLMSDQLQEAVQMRDRNWRWGFDNGLFKLGDDIGIGRPNDEEQSLKEYAGKVVEAYFDLKKNLDAERSKPATVEKVTETKFIYIPGEPKSFTELWNTVVSFFSKNPKVEEVDSTGDQKGGDK